MAASQVSGQTNNPLEKIEKYLEDISNSVTVNITENGKNLTTSSNKNWSQLASANGHLKDIYTINDSFFKEGKTYFNESLRIFRLIESHIVSLPTNGSNGQTSPQNATGSSTNFTNIESTVKDILTQIKYFRAEVRDKAYKTGDESLDERISDVRKKELEREIKRKELEEQLRENPSDQNIIQELRKLNKKEEKYKKALKKSENSNIDNVAKLGNMAVGGFKKIALDKPDASGTIDNGLDKLKSQGGWAGLAGVIASAIKTGFDVYNKQQRLGSDYARNFGGGKEGMNLFQNQGMGFINRNLQFGFNANNYSLEEFSSAVTEATESIGRSALYFSDKNIKGIADLQRFKLGGSLDIFDTFGKGGGDVSDYFKNAMGSSGRRGLSFKNVSKAIKDNLKMAQSYTFSSGLNGLIKMAETSTQLKFNMNEVAKLAEKVSTVEGAVKTSAGLSVLGGEFANFANPMQMMYEGLNDMEGLQERMVNMFGDMAYFDKSKQEITVGAFDKQRMKAASEAMGVDYNEMLNLAMNNQRGKMVESQLGSGLDEETASYIKNIAQLDKSGNAFVNLNGQELSVSSLTNENKEELKKQSELQDVSKKATLGDVFVETKTIYDKLDEIFKYIQEKLGVWVAKIAGINEFGGNNAAEEYWDNLSSKDKKELEKKYGNKSAAKTALGNGLEDERINHWYGGEEKRKFFDFKYGDGGWGDRDVAFRLHNDTMLESERKEFEEWKLNEIKKTQKQSALGENYIYGKPHQLGGELRNVEGGEAILNRTAVNGLGIDNISKFNSGNFTPISNTGNALNTLKVAPTSYSVSSPQKLSFEPININLNGKFELTSNGRNRSINLDDLDKNELKKLVMDIVKSSTPQINKQLMTLRDKGYNMEKDPFRGSGGYTA